jgi:hypothetical protein
MVEQHEAPDPGPLSRIILNAQAAGASYDTMAERAIDAASGARLITRSFLYKVARGTNAHVPTPDELRGIAQATRTPLGLIKRKAAEQYFDYTATELSDYTEEMRYIVSHLEGMSEDQVHRWRAMMEADESARRPRPEQP